MFDTFEVDKSVTDRRATDIVTAISTTISSGGIQLS